MLLEHVLPTVKSAMGSLLPFPLQYTACQVNPESIFIKRDGDSVLEAWWQVKNVRCSCVGHVFQIQSLHVLFPCKCTRRTLVLQFKWLTSFRCELSILQEAVFVRHT